MTLTGTNFAAGATVTVGGTAATSVRRRQRHVDHGGTPAGAGRRA